MVIELRKNQDLEQLLESSRTHPVLLFKHSTQCPISAGAYEQFIEFTADTPDFTSGIVLVIENRVLSETIESKLGLLHESPQAMVIDNGRVTWHASHRSITAAALAKAAGTAGSGS